MKLDDFTDKYDINSMGINIKIKDGKKLLEPSSHYGGKRANNKWIKDTYDSGLFNDTNNFTEQLAKLKKLRKNFDYRGMDTRKIHHIDVDIHDDEIQDIPAEWWDFIEMLKTNSTYYKSTTKKKGLHILFTTDMEINQNSYQTIYKLASPKKSMIEVLTGTWGWCPADTQIVDNGILEMEEDDLQTIIIKNDTGGKPAKKDTGEKVKNNLPRVPLDISKLTARQNELLELGDIINIKDLDDYDSWTKIVWSLSNDEQTNNYSIAKYISQRSRKYDEDAFNKLWDGSRNGNTIGTFYHYAKQGDIEKYNRIRAKYYDDYHRLSEDVTLAKFYMETNYPNHIFGRKNGKLHTYHNGKWKEEGTLHGLMKIAIPQQLYEFANELMLETATQMGKVANPQNEWDKTQHNQLVERQKIISKLLSQIHSCSKINSVATICLHFLSETDSDMEFDSRGELFAFRNCVWDLSMGRIVETKREDYILNDTGYDYTEPPQEDIDELKRIIKTIFPDKDYRDTYLHILATGLCGFNPEKFVIANGGGRNGKGVINELVETTLGQNYYYTAPSELLLNSKKLGGSPELANMDKKRLVVFREPDPSKKINTAFVKELTGGKGIAGRMNYSNEMIIELKASYILEANQKPLLGGNIGNGAEGWGQRFMDIPFVNTFTSDANDLEIGAEMGFYPSNSFYKTKDFREKYKIPLFKILLEYMNDFRAETGKNVWEKIPNPKRVAERTKAYLESSDEIKVWLKEAITTTKYTTQEEMYRDKDYLTPKDIYTAFKRSDIYGTLSKEEKRSNNETFFREYISTINPYRKKYEDRYKNKRSVLFGYTLTEYEEQSDEDIDI